MEDPPPAPDELRDHALDEQIQLLFKAEQRLFTSQRELAGKLRRLDVLNSFALAAVRAESTAAIVELAAGSLLSLYAFDQCLGVLLDAVGSARPVAVRAVEGREGPAAARLEEARRAGPWPAAWPEEAAFGAAAALRAEHPEATPLLDAMERLFEDPAADGSRPSFSLMLPLAGGEGRSLGVLILRRTSGSLGFHEELPSAKDAAFLHLVGQELGAALAAARLVENLRESYEELARAQEQLVRRERLAALGELAAVVAHEVRNPVGVIYNSVASLHRVLQPTGDAGVLLHIVREEADRLARIVDDLLEFARPHPPALLPERLERIITEAIESAAGGDEARVAAVRVDVSPDLPSLRCDARMVRQAMINLLTNSFQATVEPSAVDVRIAEVREDGEPFVHIEVIDSGPGISSADLEKLFQPFFTTKASGTGLGLAVVKRVTEAHGGRVTVRSTEGQGSTFVLRLPLG